MHKGLCNNYLEGEGVGGGWEMGEICPKTKFTCWISSSGTNITSNDSSTYVEESFEESSESLDSELVSSSHELGYSSPSTASLALRFPRAWVRTQEFLSD